MNFKIYLPATALLFSLLSCARRPVAHYQPLATQAAPTTAAVPKLLFVTGRLVAGALGTQLTVLGARAAPGESKETPPVVNATSLLLVSQLDAQGQVLAQDQLPHPLYRPTEYLADDQRTLQRTELRLPAAEFFVRLALRPAATTLRFDEIIAGKTTRLADYPIPTP